LAAAYTRLKRLIAVIQRMKSNGAATEWKPFKTLLRSPGIVSNHTETVNETDEWFDFTGVMGEFDDAISNDLNTAAAFPKLALVEEAVSDPFIHPDNRLRLIATMDQVFGLQLLELSRNDLRIRPKAATITEAEIETALAARKEARAAKDFAKSDAIRDDLITKGVEVMDGDPLSWDWKIDV
jgi:cysteinyl-tRNA synthetase